LKNYKLTPRNLQTNTIFNLQFFPKKKLKLIKGAKRMMTMKFLITP